MTEHDKKLWEAQKNIFETYRQLKNAAGVTKETEFHQDLRLCTVIRAISFTSADKFFIRINSIRDGSTILPLRFYPDELLYDQLNDEEFSRLVAACSEAGMTEYTMRLLRDRQERGRTTTGGKLLL